MVLREIYVRLVHILWLSYSCIKCILFIWQGISCTHLLRSYSSHCHLRGVSMSVVLDFLKAVSSNKNYIYSNLWVCYNFFFITWLTQLFLFFLFLGCLGFNLAICSMMKSPGFLSAADRRVGLSWPRMFISISTRAFCRTALLFLASGIRRDLYSCYKMTWNSCIYHRYLILVPPYSEFDVTIVLFYSPKRSQETEQALIIVMSYWNLKMIMRI